MKKLWITLLALLALAAAAPVASATDPVPPPDAKCCIFSATLTRAKMAVWYDQMVNAYPNPDTLLNYTTNENGHGDPSTFGDGQADFQFYGDYFHLYVGSIQNAVKNGAYGWPYAVLVDGGSQDHLSDPDHYQDCYASSAVTYNRWWKVPLTSGLHTGEHLAWILVQPQDASHNTVGTYGGYVCYLSDNTLSGLDGS